MQIGNYRIIWATEEEDDLPVPPPPIPVFDVPQPSISVFNVPSQDEPQQEVVPEPTVYPEPEQQPDDTFEEDGFSSEQVVPQPEVQQDEEEYQEFEINDPGFDPPPEPESEYGLTPGEWEGRSIQEAYAETASLINQRNIPENVKEGEKERAKQKALLAVNQPSDYLSSLRGQVGKARFMDPITGWVIDNHLMKDTDSMFRWLEQQGRRTELAFRPYVHAVMDKLVHEDTQRLLANENIWKKLGRQWQPRLWAASLVSAPTTDGGRVFVSTDPITGEQKIDDGLFRNFASLAQEILKTERDPEVRERIYKVTNNMLNMRISEGGSEVAKALKPARRRLEVAYKDVGSFASTLKKLTKIANKLDALGEYDLASQVDAILAEAAEPYFFVDKRPEDEREVYRDTGRMEDTPSRVMFRDKPDSPFRAPRRVDIPYEAGPKLPGEDRRKKYMIDSEYGIMEELPPDYYPEEELNLKKERMFDRDKDVEGLTEEDLDPTYLDELGKSMFEDEDPEE